MSELAFILCWASGFFIGMAVGGYRERKRWERIVYPAIDEIKAIIHGEQK